MATLFMTPTERAAGLERLGYAANEARFLELAAVHGGYFLRRQCEAFEPGISERLIEKVLAREDAKVMPFLSETLVYHLCRRPFYDAIGQEDNRNRREREPLTIKRKLMGVDVVLSRPGARFLATEEEKVAYFTIESGVALNQLPCRLFTARTGSKETRRYFVDKYPIFTPMARTIPTTGPRTISTIHPPDLNWDQCAL